MTEIISKKKKVDIVCSLIEEIKRAKQETVRSFLVIGRNLDRIQREKLWRYYGTHLERFEDFLQEIDIKHATAFNCIRIWRVFGEAMERYKDLYLEIDYFKLVRLLPVVNDENKEEWLNKANTLPPQGFNDEIREAKGLPTTDSCQHPREEREYYFRCKVCNKWVGQSLKELCRQSKE